MVLQGVLYMHVNTQHCGDVLRDLDVLATDILILILVSDILAMVAI